jgi:hypothetical protein
MKILLLMGFFAIFIIFAQVSLAASFSIGVSPGTINLGNVTAGGTKLVDFYITTPSDEALLVRLDPERGTLNFFDKAEYSSLLYNHSEEDVTGWVKVMKNPVEIMPSNETLQTTGGLIKGKEQISFLIDVPQNAEPGYHIVYIKPSPTTPQEDIGSVGSRVVAVTAMGVLFDVPGVAIRKGVILDTQAGNYIGNRLEIKTYFQNTGTTTISASATQRIYNGTQMMQELYSGREFVKPKEIKVFMSYLDMGNKSLGDYNIYSVVDYTTGKAEKSSSVSLFAPSTAAVVLNQQDNTVLIILIVAVIVIVSLVFYKRIK